MSGETIATTDNLGLAKSLASLGGVWLILDSGKVSYRWYVQEENGQVIYSPKDRESDVAQN
jgi:hypothetical protein